MAISVFTMSLWMYLSVVGFWYAAYATDLLLIKAALFFGYFFMILSMCLGGSWDQPFGKTPSEWTIPGVDWTVLNGIIMLVHLFGIMRFILDERMVTMDETTEKMWRLFWRRAGCPRLEMRHMMKIAEVRTFRKGEVVMSHLENDVRIGVVVRGFTDHVSFVPGEDFQDRFRCFSGDLFYLQDCAYLGVNLGKMPKPFVCVAGSETVEVVFWRVADLEALTGTFGPSIRSYLQNYVLYQFGHTMNRTLSAFLVHRYQEDSTGTPELDEWFDGAETRDMEPIRHGEPIPHQPWSNPWQWLKTNFSWMPPHGIRHTSPPASGLAARERQKEIYRLRGARVGAVMEEAKVALKVSEDWQLALVLEKIAAEARRPDSQLRELLDTIVHISSDDVSQKAVSNHLSPAQKGIAHHQATLSSHLVTAENPKEALESAAHVRNGFGIQRSVRPAAPEAPDMNHHYNRTTDRSVNPMLGDLERWMVAAAMNPPPGIIPAPSKKNILAGLNLSSTPTEDKVSAPHPAAYGRAASDAHLMKDGCNAAEFVGGGAPYTKVVVTHVKQSKDKFENSPVKRVRNHSPPPLPFLPAVPYYVNKGATADVEIRSELPDAYEQHQELSLNNVVRCTLNIQGTAVAPSVSDSLVELGMAHD